MQPVGVHLQETLKQLCLQINYDFDNLFFFIHQLAIGKSSCTAWPM